MVSIGGPLNANKHYLSRVNTIYRYLGWNSPIRSAGRWFLPMLKSHNIGLLAPDICNTSCVTRQIDLWKNLTFPPPLLSYPTEYRRLFRAWQYCICGNDDDDGDISRVQAVASRWNVFRDLYLSYFLCTSFYCGEKTYHAEVVVRFPGCCSWHFRQKTFAIPFTAKRISIGFFTIALEEDTTAHVWWLRLPRLAHASF